MALNVRCLATIVYQESNFLQCWKISSTGCHDAKLSLRNTVGNVRMQKRQKLRGLRMPVINQRRLILSLVLVDSGGDLDNYRDSLTQAILV